MGTPAFKAAGAAVHASTGGISVAWPAGHAAGDLGILLVMTRNEPVATPSGWAQLAGSPQGQGTAGSSFAAVALTAFRLIATSGAMPNIALAQPPAGNIYGVIVTYSGAVQSGDPTEAGVGTTGSSSTYVFPAITTTKPGDLVLLLAAGFASNGTGASSPTNSNLTALTERVDVGYGTSPSDRGSLYAADGIMAAAGNTGTSSITYSGDSTSALITIALTPPAAGGGETETVNATTGSATVSSSVQQSASETVNKTLDGATVSASVIGPTKESVNITTAGATVSATEQQSASETLVKTLDSATLNATEQHGATEALSKTLDAATVSAEVQQGSTETLAKTLGDATVSAAISVPNGLPEETLVKTLDSVSVVAGIQNAEDVFWQSPPRVAAITTEVRWRLQGSNGVWQYIRAPVGHLIDFPGGLDRGKTYEIQARNLSKAGTPSAWIAVTHVVSSASEIPQAPLNLTVGPTVSGVKLNWQMPVGVILPTNCHFAVDYCDDSNGSPMNNWVTAYATTKALTLYLTFNDTKVRWFRVYAVSQPGIPSVYSDEVNSNGIDLVNDLNLVMTNGFYSETVDNSTFTLPLNADGGIPGWMPYTDSAVAASLSYIISSHYNNANVMTMVGSTPGGAISTRKYACQQGDYISITADLFSFNGNNAWLQVHFYDAFGNPFTEANGNFHAATTAMGTWQTINAKGTTPANAAYFKILCYNSATFAWQQHIMNIRLMVNDLRVAGSGATIGNQQNLQPINWAGVRSMLNATPISYTYGADTPATVTFSCAAVTVQGGSATVSYNASGVTRTQARNTTQTWYFYYIDLHGMGGSTTLYATTNSGDLSTQDGIVNLGNGSVSIPSAASSGGGVGGGGGGGFCVGAEMYIHEGLLAGDAVPGDMFDCMDLPTGQSVHKRALWNVTFALDERIRLITNKGAAWIGGIDTPFDLPDGRVVKATKMLGERVFGDKGTQTVISAALIGRGPLCRNNLGGVSYAAGADPQNRVYSHNVGTEKP